MSGRTDNAAKMEGDPGFRSFAERCEPPEPSAATPLRSESDIKQGCLACGALAVVADD